MALPGILPPYFNKEGADAFKQMEIRESDVVFLSYPKCGITWGNHILYGLLRMAPDGTLPTAAFPPPGEVSQVYPDSCALKVDDIAPERRNPHKVVMGSYAIEDLINQPAPRLFTSHIRVPNLPPSLNKRGRLVVMVRNPKDAFISAHFFLKRFSERYPKVQEVSNKGIEWQYNQYVAVDDDASTNFSGNGDYFSYYRDCVGLARLLGDRATFVFYERLLVDFEGEIRRLARSLNVPLPPAKLEALTKYCAFGARPFFTLRKGVSGDHVNYLTPVHWRRMDVYFARRLGDLPELQPLWESVGMKAKL
eukprot:m.99646 g.99646  ORF g.99646 m.99646 type:complete len:307 (-) comp12469_c0_seq4:3128-4048(-)